MKNNYLFILLAAVFAITSCGTANRAAYNNGSQFRNSIYYTPDNTNSTQYAQQEEYLQELQQKTNEGIANSTQHSVYDASTNTKTIYMGDANSVDIEYDPGTTYSIVDDRESYEARLRKFDSPSYTINIDFGFYDPYPWWDIHYGWRSPYWSRHYYWHRPYWSSIHWDWYNPWYGGIYYGWNSYWWDPFWGPSYVHIHRPHYRPGYIGPGHSGHHRPARDVYYGKRSSSPTYNNVNRTSGSNRTPVYGRPNTTKSTAQQNSNSQYRRVKSSERGSSATRSNSTVTTNRNNSSTGNSTYRRSTNTQTRSTYSSGSSYSTRSSGSTTTRSNSSGSSSGSSYRRR